MKLILLLCICLLSNFAFSQYWTQYFDGADTVQGQSLFIQIDTSASNIWQVGPPQKTIFDGAYSGTNVLVTDTINSIPDSNVSYFEFTLDHTMIWGLLAIQWAQKIDLDSSTEVGHIEYSLDTGNTWINVFGDPNVYNFYGYQSSNTGSHHISGDQGFTGTDSLWRDIWLCYDATYFQSQDTVTFRFSIETDSIDHGSEGWMIDNMSIHETWVHTLIENSQDFAFKAFPTTTSGPIKVVCLKTDDPPIIESVELYSLEGKLVAKFRPESNNFDLDLSPYFAGHYKLKIKTNQGFDLCDIIIQH